MKVEVINDNVHDFRQKWRDQDIFIPAKGSIEMGADDAHAFVCSYNPPQVDADGRHKPESYKMLRVKTGAPTDLRLDPFLCQACGYKGVSKKDLLTHVSERIGDGVHKKLDSAELSADEVLENMSEEMVVSLAEKLKKYLQQEQPERKRGRPRKED